MIIAIDAHSLSRVLNKDGHFILECFKKIVTSHPGDHFIFISDRPIPHSFIFSPNITPVITSGRGKRSLLRQFWYDHKVTAVIKKYKADIFIASSGFCSLRSKTPQCLILSDLMYLKHPQFISKSDIVFYKKYIPRFIEKAQDIVTLSATSKQLLTEHYKTDDKKIDVVHWGVDVLYTSINWKEKEDIKEKYSGGKEYFLYAGEIGPGKDLITLLKAFSFFKKRQKSNMQLVIIDKTAEPNPIFAKDLQTYKYREEVILLSNLPVAETAKLTAAAYAFVYPSLFDDFPAPMIEAMQSSVPVVTFGTAIAKEIAGDAILYADPNNFEDLANKMMLLFKDEDQRNELIEKGIGQTRQFNWDRTADLLWQSILKTTGS